MRTLLLASGLALLASGALLAASPEAPGHALVAASSRSSEKPGAVFLLGHWVDVVWELALPCLTVGAVLCAVSVARRRALVRPSTTL